MRQASLWTVDGWPMAHPYPNVSGTGRRTIRLCGRDVRWAVFSVGTEASGYQSLATAVLVRWTVLRESWWGQREGSAVNASLARAGRSSPPPVVASFASCGSASDRQRNTLLFGAGLCRAQALAATYGRYLVDSASSHMLVSKIKPCMSKYKQLYCETANGSLNQLSFI